MLLFLAVGAGNARFISIGFVNIVVAANAGGAFSPFGDITTLMVWQKGLIDFQQFFVLFLPSAVNYLIPASIMHFAIKNEKPKATNETVDIKTGGILITILFLFTIATAVSFHNFLHLPPAMGMMTGLGYLMVASYFIKRQAPNEEESERFNIFTMVSRAEWDTLLFFFGVIVSVGGLGFHGLSSSCFRSNVRSVRCYLCKCPGRDSIRYCR